MKVFRAHVVAGCRPWADNEKAVTTEAGNHNGCLRVVHDPDSEYGFRVGAEFTRADVQLMLINHSFNLGTVIYHPSHGDMPVVEYSYPVQRGPRVVMRCVQALKGDNFYLIPSVMGTTTGYLVRIGNHGHQRMR